MPDFSETFRLPDGATREECGWLAEHFESLPVSIDGRTPSEWAEAKRYLPESVTPLPGYYRFEVAPYLKEIVDCMGVDSPVREVAVMKGVQVCCTTGLGENTLGYFVDEVKTAPVMWVTGNSDMMARRMNANIVPMFYHSDLERLIKSADVSNARKTGKTDKLVEWMGGGCLIPMGAQNPAQFRQQPAQILIGDEVDSWPLTTKNDGDPVKLVRARTNAYEAVRKILWLSTPTVDGQSKISELFLRGDQRRYFVCCLKCGAAQYLRWHRVDSDGVVSGFRWELDSGRLVPDSARYLCEVCGHEHRNDDKTKLLSPEYGAEWRPTATPVHPDYRSYHIPAMLSPVGMTSWDACVLQYLDGFDPEKNVAKDLNELQVFYNNVLGDVWKTKGQGVNFQQASAHRRHYSFGQVPSRWCEQHCGGPVGLITCTVDVHKDNLAVTMFGWTRGQRAVLIDYWRLEGDTEQLSDPGTWGRLRELIATEYVADDGKKYWPALVLIDSGYHTDQVYEFCYSVGAGCVPIKGREGITKNAAVKEFGEFTTPHGLRAFTVTVDIYKERWSPALRRQWDGQSQQPEYHFNAPADCSDDQLRELTRETKREKLEPVTKRRIGWEWFRVRGAKNELWDLLIYANAALDILAWEVCINELEMEAVSWPEFWDYCAANHRFTH